MRRTRCERIAATAVLGLALSVLPAGAAQASATDTAPAMTNAAGPPCHTMCDRIAATATLGLALSKLPIDVGQPSATDAPPAVANAAGSRCNAKSYGSRTRIASAHREPVVVQLGTRTLPPGNASSRTARLARLNQVRAQATANGSVSDALTNKLIDQGEAALDQELKSSGASTNRRSRSLTIRIVNDTRYNASFALFRGTTRAHGAVERSFCRANSAGTSAGHVRWKRVGRWQSWTTLRAGAPRCGTAQQQGPMAREALRIACA